LPEAADLSLAALKTRALSLRAALDADALQKRPVEAT
jgi:hypothetical protein